MFLPLQGGGWDLPLARYGRGMGLPEQYNYVFSMMASLVIVKVSL